MNENIEILDEEVVKAPVEKEKPLKLKRNKEAIIITGSVLFIIALIGVAVYLLWPPKPTTVFEEVVSNFYKSAQEILKETKKGGPVSFNSSMNFTVNTTNPDLNATLKEISKITLSAEGSMDLDNSLFKTNITLKYDNADMLSGDLYFENNNLYIKSKDLYNKYLLLPIEAIEESVPVYTKEEVNYEQIINKIANSLMDELKDDDFKISNDSLTIDGNKMQVKKYEITFDRPLMRRLLSKLENDIKNDKELLKQLANAFSKTEKEILDEVNDLAKLKDFNKEDNMTLSIYTKGLLHEFVKFEFGPSASKDDKEEILSLTKLADNRYEFYFASKKSDIAVTGVYSYENKTKGKTSSSDYKIAIRVKTSEMTFDLTLNEKFEETGIDKFVKEDITNSKKIEDLTEKDLTEIQEALMKNSFLAGFMLGFTQGLGGSVF